MCAKYLHEFVKILQKMNPKNPRVFPEDLSDSTVFVSLFTILWYPGAEGQPWRVLRAERGCLRVVSKRVSALPRSVSRVTGIAISCHIRSGRIDSPIMPSVFFRPKLSRIVAPMTPKVCCSGSGPPAFIDGDQARSGTFSLV